MTVQSLRIAFREWFGLSPSEADLLIALFDAEDTCVGTRTLAERSGIAPNVVHMRVHRVREALDAEAIDHIKGEGYRLTEGGREECRAACWQIAEELNQVR